MAFRARDGVAVAVHTVSGSFWVGWSILQLLVATKVSPPAVPGSVNTSLAIWFVALGAVIAIVCLGALANSVGMSATLVAYAGGLGITAAGWWAGSLQALHVAGWFLVIAAALAWYTAGAMLLEEAFGRTVLPLGKLGTAAANIPGHAFTSPLSYERGMPGVRVGQ